MLLDFYLVLTPFNKLEIMSEVVLLLPRTDRHHQVGDCQMLFYHVLTAINKLEIMSDIVLPLPFTDRLFNTLDIMSEVVPLLPRTGRHQQDGDYFRSYSTSTTYWPPSTRRRLCQRLFYFNQVRTAINKMEIMSEVVLLLPNTDRHQQVGDYVRGFTWQLKERVKLFTCFIN